MTNLHTLADLFRTLFTEDELRSFIRTRLEDGDLLAGALPGAPASLARLADDTAALLERRGRIDANLFASLTSMIPERAPDILGVAGCFGLAPATASRGAVAVSGARTSTPKGAPTDLRQWLGVYTLVLTALLGAYLLLMPAPWLPLDPQVRSAGLQIVIPCLVTHVVVVWQYYTSAQLPASKPFEGRPAAMPPSAIVKLPLALITLVLVLMIAALAWGGTTGAPWTPSSSQFMNVLTFCVTLLNATTTMMIFRLFGP